MTVKELRELTIEELLKKVSEKKRELSELEFNVRIAKESDHSSIRKTKKEIARMLTIINEKSLEEVGTGPDLSVQDE